MKKNYESGHAKRQPHNAPDDEFNLHSSKVRKLEQNYKMRLKAGNSKVSNSDDVSKDTKFERPPPYTIPEQSQLGKDIIGDLKDYGDQVKLTLDKELKELFYLKESLLEERAQIMALKQKFDTAMLSRENENDSRIYENKNNQSEANSPFKHGKVRDYYQINQQKQIEADEQSKNLNIFV